VTVAPGANPAKRVLELAVNPIDSNEIYGAIEVGGIIRSLDGGESWAERPLPPGATQIYAMACA